MEQLFIIYVLSSSTSNFKPYAGAVATTSQIVSMHHKVSSQNLIVSPPSLVELDRKHEISTVIYILVLASPSPWGRTSAPCSDRRKRLGSHAYMYCTLLHDRMRLVVYEVSICLVLAM